MQITPINSTQEPNFKAKVISKAKIKRKIPFTPFYQKVDAYFVELNSKEDVSRFGQYASKYNESPTTEAIAINLQLHPKHSKTYALTTQPKSFKQLNPAKIIGACEGTFIPNIIKPYSKFCLDSLETQSERNLMAHHQSKEINLLGLKLHINLKHKGVGTAIMKKLVEHLNEKPVNRIEVLSLPQSMPFYRTLKKWTNEAHCFSIERENFLEFAKN